VQRLRDQSLDCGIISSLNFLHPTFVPVRGIFL